MDFCDKRYLKTPGASSRGFALVLSLGVMSVVLMLLLGAVTLTRVETERTQSSLEELEWRMQAKLAASLALGQLQSAMGPDQRANAPDSLPDWGYPWNAVWERDPVDPNERRRLGWLVSGVEALVPDSEDEADFNGPTWLFRAATDDAPEGRVPVVAAPNGGRPGERLGYAWWVDDEAAKARVNFEPNGWSDEVQRAIATGGGMEAHARFAPVLSSGVALDRLMGTGDIALVGGPAPELAAERIEPHWTTLSYGVLANQREGGLLRNLDAALRESATSPTGPIFPPVTATSPTANDPGGPPWEQLRSFYNLRAGNNTTPLAVRRHTDTAAGPANPIQHGLHPVLIRMQNFFHVSLIDPEPGAPTDPSGPKRLQVRFHHMPAVALWNPYDVPLEPTRYFYGQSEYHTRVYEVRIFSGETEIGRGAVRPAERATAGPPVPTSNEYSTLRYTIEGTRFEPGEAIVFGPPGQTERLGEGRDVLVPGFQMGASFYQPVTRVSPGLGSAWDVITISGSPGQISNTPLEVDWDGEKPLTVQIRGKNNGNMDHFLMLEPPSDLFKRSPLNFSQNFVLQMIDDKPAKPLRGENAAVAWRAQPFAFRPPIRTADETLPLPLASSGPDGDPDFFPNFGFKYAMKFVENQYRMANAPLSPADFDYALEGHSDQIRWLAHYNPRASLIGISPTEFPNPTSRHRGMNHNPTFSGNLITDPLLARDHYPIQGRVVGFGVRNPFVGVADFPATGSEPTSAILFSVLREDQRLYSVAELGDAHLTQTRNFNGSDTNNQTFGGGFFNANLHPAFPIGNSAADPRVPAIQNWVNRNLWGRNGIHYDKSYRLNEVLFDRWFFAGPLVEDAEAAFSSGHPRMHLLNRDGLDAEVFETDPDEAAKRLLIRGPFNVNSRSVEAWTSVLASLREDDRPAFRRHPFVETDPFESNGDRGLAAIDFRVHRALSDEEVRTLAEALVAEITERGPFLSLSEFVNRSIRPGGQPALRRQGALAAALENASLAEPGDGDPDGLNRPFQTSELRVEEDVHRAFHAGASIYPHAEAAAGSKVTGVPVYLTQADILRRIGSFLTARSDTFRILGWAGPEGEAETNGRGVRFEMVVQRLPEWVDPVDPPETAIEDLTSPTNIRFGRRIVVRSFRWLP